MASIVLLDDDPTVLELLRTVLDEAGYKAICGQFLEDLPVGVRADLVISDLIPLKSYSRQTAVPWVAILRQRFGPVPILIITAHIAALRERDFLGAEGIVGKPFNVEALLVKVVELLGAGGQRPPTVTS